MIAFERKSWWIAMTLLASGTTVWAQTQFFPLGYLDSYGPTSEANAITRNATKIVGYSTTSLTENLACWWTTSGITPVPGVQNWLANAAYAVSADGNVIVGDRSFGGTEEAWYWTSAGQSQLIPFSGSLRASTARGLTGDGKVVVGTVTVVLEGAKVYKAFRWDRSQPAAAYLPVYSAAFPSCGAVAISDDGRRIAGDVQTGLSTQAAARWDDGGIPVLLSQNGDGVIAVSARAISPDGSVIVGAGVLATTGQGVAFRWTAGTGTTALPNPTKGYYAIDGAAALGISGNGRVITGYGVNVAGEEEAIFWVDGQPYRVSDVAQAGGVLPERWEPFRAHAADYYGNMICGYGRATSGKLEAYALVINAKPTPPSLQPPELRFSYNRERGLVVRYQTVPGLRYRIHGGRSIGALQALSDWSAGLGIDQEFAVTPGLTGGAKSFFIRAEVATIN